jgi:hypothetical protein
MSSIVVASWMLCMVFILSYLWGQSLYMWYSLHPQHLIGGFSFFPNESSILDSSLTDWSCWFLLRLFLLNEGLNPTFYDPIFLFSYPSKISVKIICPFLVHTHTYPSWWSLLKFSALHIESSLYKTTTIHSRTSVSSDSHPL